MILLLRKKEKRRKKKLLKGKRALGTSTENDIFSASDLKLINESQKEIETETRITHERKPGIAKKAKKKKKKKAKGAVKNCSSNATETLSVEASEKSAVMNENITNNDHDLKLSANLALSSSAKKPHGPKPSDKLIHDMAISHAQESKEVACEIETSKVNSKIVKKKKRTKKRSSIVVNVEYDIKEEFKIQNIKSIEKVTKKKKKKKKKDYPTGNNVKDEVKEETSSKNTKSLKKKRKEKKKKKKEKETFPISE